MKAYCGGNGQLHQIGMGEVANTLDCMHDQQMIVQEVTRWKYGLRLRARFAPTAIPEVIRDRMHTTTCFLSSKILRGGVSLTLSQRTIGKEQGHEMEGNGNMSSLSGRKFVLRRLIPLECIRLQGLPDWWCDGANGSDSAIYKMCGNGLAIPCAYDVMRRVAGELKKAGNSE